MKKSSVLLLMMVMMLALVVSACGSNNTANNGANNGAAVNEPAVAEESGEEAAPASDLNIGMVTDVGGVDDNSFNQSAWEGLQQVAEETGVSVKYLQSNTDADYNTNLTQMVQNGYDLTWGIGFLMSDALKEVADLNPDANFAIIDSVVDAPNVESVTFAENEGSYLVGLVAGKMTETDKVGFVGGVESPLIKKFEAGFTAGVKEANPDATVSVNYTGAFNKPDIGKAAAATMYNDGVDIIFHASGSTGDGVFSEATERKAAGQNVWVIGVDRDQSLTFGDDVTLTSMMKRVDQAVMQVSKQVIDGTFEGGTTTVLGLKEDGVGLPETSTANVPADVLALVDEYKEKIINGEIQVPVEVE